ncbi:hypothetical protein K2X33_11215, partial [bacterium]|nr:hypothetical protein [bacterium]
ISVAYSGGYRVARSVQGLNRPHAIVIGMLSGVGSVLNIGWAVCAHGWGFALLPWCFYVLVSRTDRPHYFRQVLCLGLLYSCSTAVIYSLPGLLIVLCISAFLLPPAHKLRFALGLGIFSFLSLVNAADVVYAVMLFAGESARAGNAPFQLLPPLYQLAYLIRHNGDFLLIAVVPPSLLMLFFRRSPRALRCSMAVLASLLAEPLLSAVDWEGWKIPLLSAYRWELVTYHYTLVVLLVLGEAFRGWEQVRWHWKKLTLPSISIAYFAFVAVVAEADHKWELIRRYTTQSLGGLALMTRVGCLKDIPPEHKHTYRFATVPSVFVPNMLTAYGLETFDGSSSGLTLRKNYFFGLAVHKPAEYIRNQSFNWLHIPKVGESLSEQTNLGALRVANVRYLLSDRILNEPGLREVAQCGPPVFQGEPHWIARLLARIGTPEVQGPPRIYELENPWPRAFVPSVVRASQWPIQDAAFYQELMKAGQAPQALFASGDLPEGAWEQRGLELLQATQVPGGYDLEFAPTLRSKPGLVVLNVPYTRFWNSAEGTTRVFPVNGYQIAAEIPPGMQQLRLRYKRPTLLRR